jgi:WD40 repeat protein/serine/threonine protein kinase
MSGSDGEQPEVSLADALAAYDDRLAAGIERASEPTETPVEPALLPEWKRLTAFLSLVEKAWPRTDPETNCWTDAPSNEQGSIAQSQPAPLEAGDDRRFGRFQIQRTLGHGGFGIVFLAWDPMLRRQIALKVPQPQTLITAEVRKRFQREALAAAGLDHPNIVPVYEAGSIGTVAYIAAAYIPGPTLALWLSRQTRPVPARDAGRLVARLAEAIEHAHVRHVLHRDLKPSNIMLQGPEEPNNGDRVNPGSLVEFEPRITDFSLAKLADGLGPDTKSGVPFGSPPYIAPEQAEGKLSAIGPPTDVYGLGSILYELLTGRPPFSGHGQLETLRQVIADDPLPPRRLRADVPADLEAVVLKCLEKDPGRRYSSASGLAADLERYLAGEPTHVRPPGRWERLRRKARRHPAWVATLMTVAACAMVLAAASGLYDARLRSDRDRSRQKEAETRASEASSERYLQYVMHIREADRLIADSRAPMALKILDQERPRPGEPDLREFSWHYLYRRCHNERRSLPGHRGDVYHIEFSPRGDLLASAGKDGTVRLTSTTSWEPLHTIRASFKEVNIAAFSPDGQTLATVDDEGKLKLWETASGHLRWEIVAHKGDAVIALFTPDGKTVITGGRNDGFIRLWDGTTGAMQSQLHTAPPLLESAAISPDGSILATGGSRSIQLWRLSDLTLIGPLGAGESAQGLAFSHDGTKIATVDEGDRLLRIWNVRTREIRCALAGHSGIFTVAFSADDRTVISAGDDATIRFWDVAGGWSPGVRSGHTQKIWCVALSPDGRTLASAGKDESIKIWDARPSPIHFRLPRSAFFCFELLDDARTLMTFENGPWQVARWDVHSGSLLERKPIHLNLGCSVAALSRNGRWLAVRDQDARHSLWDTVTGEQRCILEPKPGSLLQPVFSPDSRFLTFICDASAHASLLDLESLREIPLPCGKVVGHMFTSSNEVMAVLADASIFWWNPRTGQSKRSTPGHHDVLAAYRAVSADGRTLATAILQTGRIVLHSAETLEPIKEIPAQSTDVGPLAFSPDGRTIASGTRDRTVKIWDIRTGDQLITLAGLDSLVIGLRFSADSGILATISAGNPQFSTDIHLWATTDIEPRADQGPTTDSLH